MKKLLYIILLIGICSVLPSCDHEAKGVLSDDTTEEYQLYDFYVDQYGNEGIVSYISSTKSRKFIIVISTDETDASWGPMGEVVYKNNNTSSYYINAITFGMGMLQSMHTIGIERFPAQAWCDQKNANEPYPRAGSWRLPSYKECTWIFGDEGQNLQKLNKALYGVNGTLISTEQLYWTCVEDINNYWSFADEENDYDQANRAIAISPDLKAYTNKDRWIKKITYHVRAIKYVYYKEK